MSDGTNRVGETGEYGVCEMASGRCGQILQSHTPPLFPDKLPDPSRNPSRPDYLVQTFNDKAQVLSRGLPYSLPEPFNGKRPDLADFDP